MIRLSELVAACVALAALSAPTAQAQRLADAHARAVQTAGGGLAANSGATFRGDRVAAGRQQNLASDGQGNVAAGSAKGFSTDSGARGSRSGKFKRTSDGAVNASGQGSASTANGSSADRSGEFTRNADGTASGQRSTTATNANTGVSLDASTTYTKGSGLSRSATCTDSAGNTVSCGSR